jgi:hypothetical protein
MAIRCNGQTLLWLDLKQPKGDDKTSLMGPEDASHPRIRASTTRAPSSLSATAFGP